VFCDKNGAGMAGNMAAYLSLLGASAALALELVNGYGLFQTGPFWPILGALIAVKESEKAKAKWSKRRGI
jgi:hypothetical protein